MVNLSLIVAMTQDRLIGNKGDLPWKQLGKRLPSDMDYFKEVTMKAGIVIMGRKTWESIPKKIRPLSGRRHIVLTKGPVPDDVSDLVHFVNSVEEACQKVALYGEQACVMGGEEIYRLFLEVPSLTKAYVTTVNVGGLIGDAYFPEFEAGPNWEWRCTERTRMCKIDPKDDYETSRSIFERFGIV